MKKSFLLLPLIAAGAYLTLSSNINGYTSSNRTGAGGSTIGCGDATCHGTSSSPSTLAVMGIVVDSAGTPVTHYMAGHTYRVTLYGGALATANLHKFGFQLAAAKVTGGTQAGAFQSAALPAEATINTIGGFGIVCHNTPKADSVTSLGSAYSVSANWTAPAAGTGSVEFFGVINAVNDDGSASSADKWNSTNTTITELVDHTAVGDLSNTVAISAYPNPVVNTLNLQFGAGNDGVYSMKMYDVTGKLVAANDVSVKGLTTTSVNMNGWANGMYNVVIEHNGARKVMPVVKQ